jgi:hypothetical protein
VELLQALSEWPVAGALRRSAIAYPLVNAAHILAIGLVVGAIATLDLRLLGLFGRVPLTALAIPLSRVAAVGVLIAIMTGFLLFSVRPAAYAANPAFLTKVGLVALGVANALLLRRSRGWRRAAEGGTVGLGPRIGALVSLAVWCCAVVAGRWIAFV